MLIRLMICLLGWAACGAVVLWSPPSLHFWYQSDDLILDALISVGSPFWAIFLVIVVHELGHLVMGFCVGFRLNFIRFGPIQISPGFRFSLHPRSRTGADGWVSMLFGTMDRIRPRFVAMTFGGPLANLVSGFGILFLPGARGPFLSWFVVCSITIGLLNLVPFRRLSMISDGRRILMTMRSGPQGERLIAIMQLVTDLQNGTASEDLSPDFIAKATAIQDHSPDTVTAHAVAYSAAFYRKNDAEAARVLEICLRHSSCAAPVMREALLSDAAAFQARRRKRVDLAEQWLADMPSQTQTPGLRLWAEAAILEARGDVAGALSKLNDYEAAVLTIRVPSQREMSLRYLQRWRSELQSSTTEGKAV
ncbi:MAG TPA: M50 family metallopeptidase [Verrucomicrobiae bacterium]|jgi:hypothetical protein|nr:M50 family metallopeptidase [Verrucomicrobiae bacterium]